MTEIKSLKDKVIEYGLKQNPAVVILCILLILGISLVKETIQTEIPKHLTMIQAGYEKIASENREAMLKMNEANLIVERDKDIRFAESLRIERETCKEMLIQFERVLTEIKTSRQGESK